MTRPRHPLFPGRSAMPLLCLVLALTAACSWNTVKKNYDSTVDFVFDVRPKGSDLYQEDETPIIGLSYDAAAMLADTLDLPEGSPVYVESFENLVAPKDPAPFGRVVAEQVAAGLVQQGVAVTAGEPRLPEPDMVPGDYPASFMRDPDASRPAVLTGNYIIGQDVVMVSAAITGLEDDAVLAAYQWTVPVNDNTRTLLPRLVQPEDGLAPTVKTSF